MTLVLNAPRSPQSTAAKGYQRLWNDVAHANDEAKAVQTLAGVLADKGGRTFISRLDREDAELCIEILDHGLALHNLKTAEKQAFFVTLRRLAGCHGRLPDSMMITGEIEVSDDILASGGFADVRRGTYDGHLVAVKTMRVTEQDDLLKIRKQFCKEVVLWSTLSHPNILKLVGVSGDMGRRHFITVSEWMEHGDIMKYIKHNSVNRLELLHGAAQGLEYLHGANLTHGDLKGANILMSNGTPPCACLADFGFMTMVLNPDRPMSCSAQLEGGTLVFMSPELLVPSKFGMKNSVPTPEADIYAFGLVIFQVLTGQIPFHGVWQMELGWAVYDGLRPDKPLNASSIGFSDSLWNFSQRCWDGDMRSRPRTAEVVACLGSAAASWDGLMPPCDVARDVASVSKEETSDLKKYCNIFGPSSGTASNTLTESQPTSGPSTYLSTLSTQCSELPPEEPQEVVAKLFGGPQPEEPKPGPPAYIRSRSMSGSTEHCGVFQQSSGAVLESPAKESQEAVTALPKEPEPGSRVFVQPQLEKPCDDPHIVYPHLDQRYDPPPSHLPQKKRKGFEYFRRKFLEFFHFKR